MLCCEATNLFESRVLCYVYIVVYRMRRMYIRAVLYKINSNIFAFLLTQLVIRCLKMPVFVLFY